jgi:hypothetical protein
MPWSTSSLLITGVPDVLSNLCSLLDSLALHYPHSLLLYVSIPTYAVHHISAVLGLYINSIAPLHINVKVDRPIGALVLAIQSVRFCCPFHCAVSSCLNCCRQSVLSFSTRQVSYPNHCVLQQISPKANWGNHTIYDSDGSPFVTLR